ncbi:MAG TPA: hypothetical protein VLA66_12305, partial [Thermoanaerobaculia bacterium]|nr:hypothetical protein [Thermoanaerobaculia bacterium]
MRRTAIALGLGGAAALALEAWLPATPAEGLRGTLVVLPLVVAVLVRVATALGVPRWPAEEVVAGVVAVSAALGHDRLGWSGAADLAALALLGLVAARILRLAPGLRRALERPGRRAALLAAAVPFAAYLALVPWASASRPPNGDEPYYLLLAESLAGDLDVDLADEYRDEAWRAFGERPIEPQPGDPVGPAGEVYSRHDPFLPLVLAPFWALGGLAGARLAMLLVAAGLAAAIWTAARSLGAGGRGAFRAWALAAFAPPVLLLSHQIWIELPAALLVAIALTAYGRARSEGSRWTPARGLAFALPLALLPLLKLRLLAVAAPLALLGLTGARGRRGPRLAALAAVTLTGALLLVANAWFWGNPLRMHSVEELALLGVPLERFLRGGLGLGFDVAFGLFAAAPLWLLALPGAVRSPRRGRAIAFALVAFLPYFVLVASRREWYGGWSPPFRYGIVALPVLAAAVALALERRPAGAARSLIVALAAATAARTAAVVVEPGWAFSLADGRSTLLDLVGDGYAADLSRFAPSMVRPRLATWLVPLAAIALLALVFRRAGRRPRRAGAAGVALLLAGIAGWLVAGRTVPTRIVHVEDPWV